MCISAHKPSKQSSKTQKRVELSENVSDNPFKVKEIESHGIIIIFYRKGRRVEIRIDRLSSVIMLILFMIIIVAVFLYLPPLLELVTLLKFGTSK